MLADALIRWSARLFVAFYFARLCIDAANRQDETSQRFARWFWTCGLVVFVAHVILAFHYLHRWSHAAAYEHVAKRTAELTGFASGVGLYINYLFLVLWLADTTLWWRDLRWSQRRLPYWSVQAVFAFLMVQATAVFGPPFWIPITIAAVILLIGLRLTARRG